MCWPQPAQVVLPQVRHFTARHITDPFYKVESLSVAGSGDRQVFHWGGVETLSRTAAREGLVAVLFHGIRDSTEAIAQELLSAE